MKVDLTRLDKEFMAEMLIKTYGVTMDAESIEYIVFSSSIRIESDGYYIIVWECGLITFAYDDFNLEVISLILNRLKTCDNCSHWRNYNDMQGKCDLSLRGIEGDNVDENGNKVVYDTDLAEDRVELSCDGDIYNYEVEEHGVYCNLEPSGLFSDIRILFGKNFSCSRHNFKDVK